ncbi:MAG: hypothetical protein EBU90_21810 [Proteobacteria bacterium]|nr:hypothetical protein [Pseudomonadota bacterium]
MNKYLYSLLLLTAFSSQLKPMDRPPVGARFLEFWRQQQQPEEGLPEAAKQLLNQLENSINNNDDFQIINNIMHNLLSLDRQVLQVIMDHVHSPLISAVKGNKERLVGFIVQDPRFLALANVRDLLESALVFASDNLNEPIKRILDEALQNQRR